MITNIEDYFARGCGRCARYGTSDCATQLWADTLRALRMVCRDLPLEESLRWGHPCYRHAGRNVAIIGAQRSGVRLSFFDAALMTDPEGLLERQGPNTPHPDTIRLTGPDQVRRKAAVLKAYLGQAMQHAACGAQAPRDTTEPALPEDLIAALDTDADLAGAFHALTPGRRKSYVLALSRTKTSDTRQRQIARFRDRILAGKGLHDR